VPGPCSSLKSRSNRGSSAVESAKPQPICHPGLRARRSGSGHTICKISGQDAERGRRSPVRQAQPLDWANDLQLPGTGISYSPSPYPEPFSKQTQLQLLLGDDFSSRASRRRVWQFTAGPGSGRVAHQPSFAGFLELSRSSVVEPLGDAFPPAQLGMPDPQRGPSGQCGSFPRPNIDRGLPGALYQPLRRRIAGTGALSHLRSSYGYDEPDILSS
jgi:hypothetical protein